MKRYGDTNYEAMGAGKMETTNEKQRPDSGNVETVDSVTRRKPGDEFLTTPEAAAYLRKSPSWLLRQPDIAYLPGKPNLYRRTDLDAWFDRAKTRPRAA